MSTQNPRALAGRRGTAKANRKTSASDKPKLEPLPEIPDSSTSIATTPKTASPAPSHASSVRARMPDRNSSVELERSFVGSSPPLMHASDYDGAMQDDVPLSDASVQAPTSGSDRQSPLPQLSQRPRSRTGSPWRGKGRGAGGGIFARPRLNPTPQGTIDTPLSQINDGGSHSATTVSSEGLLTSSGLSSAGLVLERTATIPGERADHLSTQRRRGLTLDPDNFGVRQTSPGVASGTGTVAGRALLDGRTAQLAPVAHFHVSTNNIALAVRTDRRLLQPAQSHHPNRLAKNDSGSSSHTVSTVELEASASSTHSTDQAGRAPRGQLAKMLFSDTVESGVGGSDQLHSDTPALGAVKGGAVLAGSDSAGVLGRTKRGSSGGGDSRLGDYKGALMRPPVLSVFGTRARTSGSEQQGVPLGSEQTDSQEPRSGVAYSGPTDASGVYIPSSADTAEDVRNATATSRLHTSGKESTSGGQQPRAVPPQGAGPQGVWLHTSPGERSGGEGVIGGSGHLRPPQQQTQSRPARISTAPTQQELAGIEDAHVAKSSESISSGALQYSRESRQTGRTPAGTQQQQQQSHSEAKSSGSVDTLALLPAVSGSQTMSSGNRLTVGSDPALLGRGDIDAWRAENSETSDCDGVAPNQPHNPWSFVRSPNHKKTLTSNFPIAWSAIAASPDVEPICAVAGREGLHLLTMGPDHIVERISLTVGRRWTLAMHFNDVVWRPMDYIATGSHNGKVTIWDPARRNEQSVRTYGDVVRSVTRLTSKPGDPNFVYSAFSDGSIFGYDIRDASNSPALRLAFQSPQDIHCNPSDANYIASIAQEGRLSTWDIRMPTKAFLSFVAHSSTGGRCVAWHHNGRFIGSGGSGTDPVIRIWDVQKACEKAALEPSCEIKTSNSVHRLQWRPGYDTQISSCAFSTDPRLQIWDITNNHHNMLFHDKHIDKITGFVWYDENTVWSVGRDHQIIQCDMRSSDVVVTSKLFSNVAAEFSPSTHLAVATGVHCPRSSSASATEQLAAPHFDMEPHVKRALQNQYGNSSGGRGKAKRVASGSSRSGADSHVQEQSRSSRVASNELAYMAKFAFDLPRPSVDEHPLDPTLAVNSVAICKLARNYHYDPDAFVDCCMHNSGQALAVGFVEIAKFWLFLSAVFGDTLPLKAKRRAKHSIAKSALLPRDITRLTHETPQVVPTVSESSQRSHSANTSRSSSGMFPSRSVTTSLLADTSSVSNEMTARHADQHALPLVVRQTHTPSLAQLHPTQSLGVGGGSGRLERSQLSLSHSNLQQVALPSKHGRPPSPLSRPFAHSMSSPPSNYVSEPSTPAYLVDNPRLLRTNTVGGNLSLARQVPSSLWSTEVASNHALHLDIPVQPRSHDRAMPSSADQQSLVPSVAGSVLAAASPCQQNHPPAFLLTKPQRHVSKAELRMAVNSCQYYADGGDVQTALTAALLLRNFIHLPNWHATESWFCAYIRQLDQFHEYAVATEILLASPFYEVQDLVATRNTISVNCSNCGSPIATLPSTGISQCSRCQQMSNSCAVCELSVRGRFIWCHGCSHGGHAEHMWSWFEDMKQSSCPSGCGHACQLYLHYNPNLIEE